jgi:predicted DNA-binding transcriptional regulator AlpA
MNHQASPALAIVRIKEAMALTGLGRTSIHHLCKAGAFKKVRLGKRAVGFLRHELQAWIESRVNASSVEASS